MENNKTTEERMFFLTKNYWKDSDSEANKYEKALCHLIDKLTYTVPNSNPACLTYRLLNLFFWNKTE